jgi:hypothetical protein
MVTNYSIPKLNSYRFKDLESRYCGHTWVSEEASTHIKSFPKATVVYNFLPVSS